MSRVEGNRPKADAPRPYRSRAEMLAAEEEKRKIATPRLPYVSILDPNRKAPK
jgi:hypothetical protein